MVALALNRYMFVHTQFEVRYGARSDIAHLCTACAVVAVGEPEERRPGEGVFSGWVQVRRGGCRAWDLRKQDVVESKLSESKKKLSPKMQPALGHIVILQGRVLGISGRYVGDQTDP
jgi:hypothetical protein